MNANAYRGKNVTRPSLTFKNVTLTKFIMIVLGNGASQLTPFHYAFVFGFGVLCFYIGRADSMQERLEEQSQGITNPLHFLKINPK